MSTKIEEPAAGLRFVRCSRCKRLLAQAKPQHVKIKAGDTNIEMWGNSVVVVTCSRCGQNTTVAEPA